MLETVDRADDDCGDARPWLNLKATEAAAVAKTKPAVETKG